MTKDNFMKMRFYPFEENLVKKYPDLDYDEFQVNDPVNKLKSNQILAYIIGMYSPDSPLNTISDYATRKATMIELVGFHKEAKVIEMAELKLPVVNDAITLWFKLYFHPKFEMFVSMCESFSEQMCELRKEVTEKDSLKRLKMFEQKAKLQKIAFENEKEIERFRNEILKEHGQVSEIALQGKIRKMPGHVERFIMDGQNGKDR